METNLRKAQEMLRQGKIGVLPTDTVYGIHGLALNKRVVEKIYEIRERNPKKPFIILISSIKDLQFFKIGISTRTKEFLDKVWPNKVSVILPCREEKFRYLHRETYTLAFRIPKNTKLLNVLSKTGPLISTSVNPEGLEPASTIQKAKEYFGNKLDFYVDAGTIRSMPSTLINIKDDHIKTLRQGEVYLTFPKNQNRLP